MKLFVILHSTDFEDCTYIVSIHKSKRKAEKKIEKDFPKFKYHTNGEQECWHGNGCQINIDECKLEE